MVKIKLATRFLLDYLKRCPIKIYKLGGMNSLGSFKNQYASLKRTHILNLCFKYVLNKCISQKMNTIHIRCKYDVILTDSVSVLSI